MQNMIKKICCNKRRICVLFLMLLSPLLVYILDYMVVMTFNLGTYLGTVVRFIFERISC